MIVFIKGIRMDNCIYLTPCNSECQRDYRRCGIYEVIDNIMNRQMFKSRVNKRVFRREHGHQMSDEQPNFSGIDISYVIEMMQNSRVD